MNIHQILMDKAKKNELAHFYIIESSSSENAYEDLMGFTHHFIREYYQKIEGSKQSLLSLMDHPDVYVMGTHPENEEKKDPNYPVTEAEALIRFFEFKAVQGKRKFAVIPEGHKITNIVANKWLKLLEEPIGNSTIFLLNPRRQKLIETIHSRAQHLRLPFKANHQGLDDLKSFLATSAGQGLAQFIESNSKEARDVFFWSNELIYWEAEQSSSPESKMALVNWLKTLKEMETFHQPAATKWTLFYSYLQQYVLNRLSH
jgi:DNA polymerase III delta prime subunit